MTRKDTRAAAIRKGGGLGHWPAGRKEREARDERKATIDECRKSATLEVIDGRPFAVVRLPDAYASDYPVQVDEEDAA